MDQAQDVSTTLGDWSAVLPGRRSAFGWCSFLLGLMFLASGALGVIAHHSAWHDTTMLAFAAGAPYLMLAAIPALLLLAFSRSMIAVVAVLLTAAGVWIQAPRFVSQDAGSGPQVNVMTANLQLGLADPAVVVAAVRNRHVDVLMLQELTAAERQALGAAGLDDLLPNNIVDARPIASGVGLWSRYPLADAARHGGFTFALVTADLTVPGVRKPVHVMAAHMCGPSPGPPVLWQRDMANLPTLLHRNLGPTLVGGDFNATPDTAQFRVLLTGGYSDAAAQAGAGNIRSWPADRFFPPLLAIDHVLTRSAVATSAVTVSLPGSDHRALATTVRISE